MNFLEPWLFAGSLQRLSESGTRDPRLDAELLSSFMTETRLFLQSQIREDRSVLELWTAEYTFVNERLARLYGIQGVSSTDFRRVSWPDPQRAGILGQGSFLASTSVGDRTSPTIRGRSILKLFTGSLPPDPPPNVPAISTTRTSAERPMRERLEQHTSVGACTSCHVIFDPLGLALENFDSIGQFRRTEFNTPIDVSGTFTDGVGFTTVTEFREKLLKYRDAYYSNLTQGLLGFALGRRPTAWKLYDYEMPAVRAILREAAAKDYGWSAILAGIVKSTPFQMKEIVP